MQRFPKRQWQPTRLHYLVSPAWSMPEQSQNVCESLKLENEIDQGLDSAIIIVSCSKQAHKIYVVGELKILQNNTLQLLSHVLKTALSIFLKSDG